MYTRLTFRSTLKVKKMLDWQNATECGTIAEKICLFSCRAYWAVRSKSDVCLVYKSLFEDCAFLFCCRELDLNEAQCLVAGLNSGENTLVSEILVTMANCAAFTTSQDSLRQAGLIVKIPILLTKNPQLKPKVLDVISNMVLNEKNNQGKIFIN